MPFVAKNADAQVGQDRRRPRREGDPRRDPDRDHRRPRRPDRQPVLRRARPGRDRTRACRPRRRPASGRTATGTTATGRRTRSTSTRARPSRRCATGWPGTSRSPTRTRRSRRTCNDTSLAKKREAAEAVLDMPGVMASYYINGAQNDYTRFGTNQHDRRRARVVRPARRRAGRHDGQQLGAGRRRASRGTNVTYGVIGDHGGSQKLVQNIPMVFYGPGVSSKDSNRRDPPRGRAAHDPRRRWASPTTRATLDGKAVRLSKPQG